MASNWFEQIGGLLQKYQGGNPPTGREVEQHYDQVARSAPAGTMTEAIASAFRSAETPPFAQIVSQLFARSDPNQKAALLTHLVSGGATQGLQNVFSKMGLQGNQSVSPEAAQTLSSEQVHGLASDVEKHDPSIVERVGGFYAQHPDLVKTLGVAALSAIVSRVLTRAR